MAFSSAIYNNIYNFYNSVYAPKSSSRFDAHNKSELKNTYKSIVGLSKEEPVFLLDRSAEIQNYTISMKESAMQFKRDISSMGGMDAENLFEQKTVYSSDDSVVSASFLPGKAIGEESGSLEIEVKSLAQKQINSGAYLPPDSLDIEPGSYSFDVSTNVSNYELQFNISDTDTNHTVQARLARLINNAGIGMHASLAYDDKGNSALVISSVSTGPGPDGEPPFTVSDEETSQKRGIIDYLGIREPTQPATWARYSINGEEKTSPVNTFEYDKTYSLELKSVSDKPVTISSKADFESLKQNIIGVAGAYNNFIKTASEYLEKYPRTTVLVDTMKRMSSFYGKAMDNLGIERKSDGSLEVNEENLSKSLYETATSDDVSSLKDFTKSALRKISRVQLNPMDYADKRIVAYKNPTKTHYANPYITSAYSGMMFNSYM